MSLKNGEDSPIKHEEAPLRDPSELQQYPDSTT